MRQGFRMRINVFYMERYDIINLNSSRKLALQPERYVSNEIAAPFECWETAVY
jgi:hypothetical protein